MIILFDTTPGQLRKYLRKLYDNETRNPHKYKMNKFFIFEIYTNTHTERKVTTKKKNKNKIG